MQAESSIPAERNSKFHSYLLTLAIVVAISIAAAFLPFSGALQGETKGADHFAALPLNGDYSWYLNLGGRHVPEMQDFDLFYHNVGHSIENARKADIIFLGPSFVAYALDPELLQEFDRRYGIKSYNMAFIGVRSGDFSRQVIERWGIHPKLWVINADDQFEHFFAHSLMFFLGPRGVPIATVSYGQLRGWLSVATRNMRWRLENSWAHWSTGAPWSSQGIYRRPSDGSVYLGFNPRYNAPDNAVLRVSRDQNCHTTQKIIDSGREYLKDIGSNSVLMLVPHSQYCPQQARELAAALKVEALLTAPNLPVTTVDGGGHLDHNGAVAFTRAFLAELEKSPTFARVFAKSSSR